MTAVRWASALAFLGLVLASAPSSLPAASAPAAQADEPEPDAPGPARLRVMTFNIKGLPFPAATGRPAAMARIANRLARLRSRGRQPQVVALQEAFTSDAKAIAALAGYRYVAIGPQPGDLSPAAPATMPSGFRARANWLKGETEGKWLDSGLVILSDYPIRATRRLAFAPDDRAGFDCLATKGVLVAWVTVPGFARPVAIADTHLNSRRATGVSVARADDAYARQIAAAEDFVSRAVDAETPLVFTGDFNIGHVPCRIRAASRITQAELLRTASRHAVQASPDVTAIAERGKDKQFYRSGLGLALEPIALRVPFGRQDGADTLSDHIGFYGEYELHPGAMARES